MLSSTLIVWKKKIRIFFLKIKLRTIYEEPYIKLLTLFTEQLTFIYMYSTYEY